MRDLPILVTTMAHNEDSRVKIPALIHLTRLGYTYFSLKDDAYQLDGDTNIIKNIFCEQFLKINGMSIESEDDKRVFENEFQNIVLELGQDDLGKQFFQRLLGQGNSSYKLIDWGNFSNNTFHVCTELTCKNGEDEFRPDITVFVNGLPVSFIEVKKPNNPEGIKAERDRINTRFKNPAFRKFINITQLLVFSNNMEYDDIGADQLQGAFYATTARNAKIRFNNFREELKSELVDDIKDINSTMEDFILKDTNYTTLKYAPEFMTNKNIDSPTNRILTSLFTKHRLHTFLQYAIVYVDEIDDSGNVKIEKHIMRYPQFFATKAIKKRIESGDNRGIIWHTQGSGKTALVYYNIKYLTDHFSKQGIVPKFYFVVDRLDLLTQTEKEFRKRGLQVKTVNSKQDLLQDFKSNTTTTGITVINIQKFREDTTVFNNSGYDIAVQRVYFIDEAHRSYDPKGSFLANLYNSDKQAIKIALTGTPLIVYNQRQKIDDEEETLDDKADVKTTRNIFGDYIHKYYYNNSIKDGYTLKLLREEIETSYKQKLQQIQRELQELITSGSLDRKDLYAHEKFVDPMLDYIANDFVFSRTRFGDKTIGAMVVCDSSEQARVMHTIFIQKQVDHGLSSALILHDENDKQMRKDQIQDFKDGKIDILFVYAMLLTGFDAPRLKKLYLGRKIKAHNLLQTLTRVNRPYKDFRLGYVVDFADISHEFDVTNKAYFEELNREYDTSSTGENHENIFGSLFMSPTEIASGLEEVNKVLIDYTTDNLELFSQQITAISDRKTIATIKKALEQARDLYNIARLVGDTESVSRIDMTLISSLLNEVNNRLRLLSLQEAVNDVDSKQLLNVAIENVVFNFRKTGEEELNMLANDLQETAHRTRVALNDNWNKKDPEWISLYEAFKELLSKHQISEHATDLEHMKFESREFKKILDGIKELNRKNELLQQKFGGDKKFARVYKTLEPSGKISNNMMLFTLMQHAKAEIDHAVQYNEGILANPSYFSQFMGPVINNTASTHLKNNELPFALLEQFRDLTVKEYVLEYNDDSF